MEKKEGSGNVPDFSNAPTQHLREEHKAFLLKLDLLDRSLRYLQGASGDVLPERMEVEQTLLQDLVLALERDIGPHFQKEEEALFPVLANYIGKEHGPIEVMIHEHKKIREIFGNWKKNLLEFYQGVGFRREGMFKALSESGFEFTRFLRHHINKEDQILFKICQEALTAEEKRQVNEEMKGIRIEGEGKRAEDMYRE